MILKAVRNSKMAAKILDDILNNFLSLDCLLNWLSNKNTQHEENIFLNQYECTQVDFVSYFLVFLREQCSRDFQIYDAETPRKNSHSRIIKNSSLEIVKSNPSLNTQQNSSLNINHLDLESLQSFPTLSSSSSIMDSERKSFETTDDSKSNSLFHGNSSKDYSEKKLRRVKLFSETLGGDFKKTNSYKKELELLENLEVKQTNENKFAVSTPKSIKNNFLPAFDGFNSSDFLPESSPKSGSKQWKNLSLDVSPEISSVTPKSRSFSGDTSHKSKDNKMHCRMSLGDFILNDTNSNDYKKEKKVRARKRINPVRVNSTPQLSVDSAYSEKTDDSFDSSRLSILEEKSNLRIDREEKINVMQEEQLDQVKFQSAAPVNNLSDPTETQADLELTTYITELKILTQIYSFLIDENYCQNVTVEFCFVIGLLVIQDYNKKTSEFDLDCKPLNLLKEKNFFGSIHNCVYFAVEMLWLQRDFLVLLNLSALKLLSENSRIEKFNADLKKFLVNAYLKRQSSEEIKKNIGFMKASMQGFVSFQYETDNRENFTSDLSFNSFRKQRDLFYNILEVWEANHLVNGWIFSIGLGSKIRSLISLSSDPINLLHLSRLFRNQLIMSCYGENQTEEDYNEEILHLLPSADPNKILRLRARLTSSPKRQGLCPLPDFTGHQEFYKDFILCTSHSSFHEHLKNSFCDEILRLNDTELTGDIEDDDSNIDEQTQERYLQCTNILRLLAKFLGFVEFLPYRGEKPHSERILNIHCSVRNNTLPLFDALSCLNSAMKKQKLILTIPWIVSYLSMIDPYSAHLKFYQNVWRQLILIYKHLKTFKNVKNSFYLKLTLGWIFHLPSFPSEKFYTVVDEYNKNSAEILGISFGEEFKVGLDFYSFVEETVLYTVCPFLNEINSILSENLGCTVKHIRPVTTQENSFSKLQASKQLELRLESNFLHNQSSSTRKTVEFVTERVASITIKHLIHHVIPKIKEGAWTQLESLFTNDLKEAETESEALSEKCYQELLTTCEKENWEISGKRSEVALKALLSNDLQGSVADTCAKIVTRQAIEKVQRWMQSHITLAMIKKEFLSITRKKFIKKSPETNNGELNLSDIHSNKSLCKNSYHLPAERRVVTHDTKAWPVSQTLKTIRELVWKIYQEGSDTKEVEEVLEETIRTLENRNDVILAAEKTLFFLLVDLIVMFCVRSENDVSNEIYKTFFRVLDSLDYQNYSNTNLERIICPRNVALIRKDAKNKEKAWQNLGNFLILIMENKYLTKEQVETQLLSLFKVNWEKEEGMQFSKFISNILERYSVNNGCDKFSLLLEYMIETFNEDESRFENIG